MKRFWPLAFLVLLFAALVSRPAPPPFPRSSHGPRIVHQAPIPLPEPAPAKSETAAAPASPSPEEPAARQSAVGSGLLWLARNQNEDGSWGDLPATLGGRTIGKAGVTSLALLSLLGAGYSQLSKDEYDGDRTMGTVVKKALQWLMRDLREDGRFRSVYDEGFDQALATHALCEAYGMTASQPLQEPAERAVLRLLWMQGADGSWGGAESTAWAVQALTSARLSELTSSAAAEGEALRYINRTPHPGNAFSRILLNRKKHESTADVQALAAIPPPDDGSDLCALYHATHSVFLYEGPDGALWKKWNDSMKNALIPLQSKGGQWQGGTLSHTVVRTSLANLTLEVYYRYDSMTGSAR